MPLNGEMKAKTEETRMSKLDIDGVKSRMVAIRGQMTLLDRDVAELYGVATREINQAVRNNPGKFPEGYVVELDEEESTALRSKILTLDDTSAGRGRHSKYNYKVFTERGLYMLATIATTSGRRLQRRRSNSISRLSRSATKSSATGDSLMSATSNRELKMKGTSP